MVMQSDSILSHNRYIISKLTVMLKRQVDMTSEFQDCNTMYSFRQPDFFIHIRGFVKNTRFKYFDNYWNTHFVQ